MTETALPAPLVPPEVDLRDYGYMPLEVRRLLTSESWIEWADHPRAAHAAICLWCESWHQVPAASLPDNDKVMARLAMCGVEDWAAIKATVLRGWIKCSDGRLYHGVVAEKAIEAWEHKRRKRERTKAATEARQRQRIEDVGRGDGGRHVQRDDQRNDQRDVQRNVHQEKRREGNRREQNHSHAAPIGAGSADAHDALQANGEEFDPVKDLFETGIRILTAAGHSQARARAVIGKWRKAVPDEKLISFIVAAAKATEPIAYIEAAIRKHHKPHGEAMLG
jgi:hypothetical protein